MMQLYAYDFGEILGSDVSDEGLFGAPDVQQYFGAARRHPFLVRVDGRLVGARAATEPDHH